VICRTPGSNHGTISGGRSPRKDTTGVDHRHINIENPFLTSEGRIKVVNVMPTLSTST